VSDHSVATSSKFYESWDETQIKKYSQLFYPKISINHPQPWYKGSYLHLRGIEKEKSLSTFYYCRDVKKETTKDIIWSCAKKGTGNRRRVKNGIIQTQTPLITQPDKNIHEQMVAIPPSVSLETIETRLKMWKDQYERGEVPITTYINHVKAGLIMILSLSPTRSINWSPSSPNFIRRDWMI